MKRLLIIIIPLFLFNVILYSQDNCSGIKDGEIWVLVTENSSKAADSSLIVNEPSINTLLKGFSAKKLRQVFPYSKKDYLQRVFKIEFEGRTEEFINQLESINNGYFEKIITRQEELKVSLYDPSDYMWTNYIGLLWHLTSIDAESAWDISKGDTSTKIAILDTWFDINHPDLENKIYPLYDPYDYTYFTTDCQKNNHGTGVASFVAAETDGGGQLPGIGFDCMIIGYQAHDGEYIERAHDASLRMNADVLTSSAGGWDCYRTPLFDSTEFYAVEEIIENGTIIVMPAGNGVTGVHCRYSGDTLDSPYFPLHPVYDTNIIIVSSIGIDDKHYYYDPVDNREETHSHYPEVDICSPGYNTMKADCTEEECPPDDCCVNTWPYYESATGTSFATPIVAGVCGLMKSINPCLNQSEAQYIIKSTADEIEDADDFPGLVGAGKINAYGCVLAAAEFGTNFFEDETICSSQTTEAQYGISFNNVTIASGTQNFITRREVSIDGSFQINLGAIVTFDVDESNIIDCD